MKLHKKLPHPFMSIKSAVFISIFFLTIFSSNAQCISSTDCDGDGIANSIDLDDDNDGILDINEYSCPPSIVGGTISSFLIDNQVQTTSTKNVISQSNSSSPFSNSSSYTFSYGTNFGKRLE